MIDLNNRLTAISLLPANSNGSTATGTGVDIKDYIGKLKVTLDSEGGAGTTPVMNVKLQDSADDSTYADIAGATFTEVDDTPAVFESISVDTRGVSRYIRAVATITGTNPVFVCAVSAVGQKQVA